KLSGTYEVPYGVMLGAYYSGATGYPLRPTDTFPDDPAMGAYTLRFNRADNPLIVAEAFIHVAGIPRGTYLHPFRKLLSLRGEKDIKIGRTKLSLMADVFNALNISSVIAVQTLKYNLANFLKPAAIENPAALRLGVRYEF